MQRKFRRHMYTDIQYSLREHFKKLTDVPMIFIKNGEPAPIGKLPIYHLLEEDTSYDMLSKQREAVVTTTRYKIEIYGRNLLELKEMQGVLTEFILFEDIPYIHHEDGKILGRLEVAPSFMGMEYLKDTNRETDHYRKQFYFDVEVILHKNIK